ncbi:MULTISPECIES: ABC transporter permease [Propionibacterium]|uniref:ABC transporter permease n=1 Tax=Propionibacterium TaxID=1743 RepID=UPI000541E12E|nr:ABC transporter permease [Propionibacterium freudenreichii]MCT2980516.1 ABC transporter permease [Propionibacterium freudenreichii]MDK9301012.1 ABC transporter permease [Propionibacterium freudenreichii]MDK9321239.1 ABC transporter permease [Propionibacterium freudenreichii]MDK9323067.1 ABC transporter permease [Propionibacterium freudenreichii]MDK9340134.1 ABC transporter permease [Propionibacterium freudenreichii]
MRRASLVVGVGLLTVVVVFALVGLFWLPDDPVKVQAQQALLRAGGDHLLGTDGYGRDILARLMVGARSCLLVGVVSVAIGAIVGVPVGIWSGMSRPKVGRRIMQGSDILYAFPAILLAILLAAANGSGTTLTAMSAIGIAAVPAFARVANSATRGVMSHDYIAASRSSGIDWVEVARSHVLPNIAPVVLVQSSSSLGMAVLAEAALSYLGLGTPPTTPTWGRMLYDAQPYMYADWLQVLWPALFIAIAVLGFNLTGDGLREIIDPRLREDS